MLFNVCTHTSVRSRIAFQGRGSGRQKRMALEGRGMEYLND